MLQHVVPLLASVSLPQLRLLWHQQPVTLAWCSWARPHPGWISPQSLEGHAPISLSLPWRGPAAILDVWKGMIQKDKSELTKQVLSEKIQNSV